MGLANRVRNLTFASKSSLCHEFQYVVPAICLCPPVGGEDPLDRRTIDRKRISTSLDEQPGNISPFSKASHLKYCGALPSSRCLEVHRLIELEDGCNQGRVSKGSSIVEWLCSLYNLQRQIPCHQLNLPPLIPALRKGPGR